MTTQQMPENRGGSPDAMSRAGVDARMKRMPLLQDMMPAGLGAKEKQQWLDGKPTRSEIDRILMNVSRFLAQDITSMTHMVMGLMTPVRSGRAEHEMLITELAKNGTLNASEYKARANSFVELYLALDTMSMAQEHTRVKIEFLREWVDKNPSIEIPYLPEVMEWLADNPDSLPQEEIDSIINEFKYGMQMDEFLTERNAEKDADFTEEEKNEPPTGINGTEGGDTGNN